MSQSIAEPLVIEVAPVVPKSFNVPTIEDSAQPVPDQVDISKIALIREELYAWGEFAVLECLLVFFYA